MGPRVRRTGNSYLGQARGIRVRTFRSACRKGVKLRCSCLVNHFSWEGMLGWRSRREKRMEELCRPFWDGRRLERRLEGTTWTRQ